MTKKVGSYELGDILGEGAYGKVRSAIHSDSGEKVAIKIIDKGKVKIESFAEHLKKEVTLMRMVKHENVVQLREVLASNSKIYVVLELIQGGDLFEKIGLSEKESRFYWKQIIYGVEHCHSLGIVHRDLKAENILLTENGLIKVSDFGFSSLVEHNEYQLMHTTCGTLNYIAPEILKSHGYEGKSVDIWSCGVILFFCLTNHLPFEDESIAKTLDNIAIANVNWPKNISASAQDLLRNIFIPQAHKRYTIEDIKEHPWFMDDKVNKVKSLNLMRQRSMSPEKTKRFTPSLIEGRKVSASPAQPGGKGDNIKTREFREDVPLLKLDMNLLNSDLPGPEVSFPQKMNAFGLLNYCCSKIMNKMFEPKEKQNRPIRANRSKQGTVYKYKTEFTSQNTIDFIISTIEKECKELNAEKVHIDTENSMILITFELNKKLKNYPKLLINCELYQLTTDFYMIQFTKEEGVELDFKHMYDKLYTKLDPIICKPKK